MPQQARIPVLSGAADIAYIADTGGVGGKKRAVFRVDINTGDRTVISGQGVGTGAELDTPVDVIVDGDKLRVLSLSLSSQSTSGTPSCKIYEIDRVTGDRTLWVETDQIVPQTFIDDGTQYVITGLDENFTYGMFTIDKTTKVVTGPIGSHPSNQALGTAWDGVSKYYTAGGIGTANTKVWEWNSGTGVFTDVSGGTGASLDQVYWIDHFGGKIYCANKIGNNIIEVDPATGNKTELTFTTGVLAVQQPAGVTVLDAETLYFTTPYPGSRFFFEFKYAGAQAGFNRIASGGGQGDGVNLETPHGIALARVLPGQPY